jgi:uncharacterized protein
MTVILDTNVFVSGFVFGGRIQKIFDLYFAKEYSIIVCEELENEISDKLINKFQITKTQYEIVLEILGTATKYNLSFINKHTRDPGDDFLVELAMISNCDYLVSDDKDLLVLGSIGNTEVIRPNEFLELFDNFSK